MILIFVSFSPTLLGANTIKISTGHWPPYLSEDLPGGGFVSQIIRESFESEGVDVEFAFLPWSRALAMTKSGKYQASAICSLLLYCPINTFSITALPRLLTGKPL